MVAQTTTSVDPDGHKVQQAIKWIVYTLLIINFVFYILEDWNRAIHTLDAESTILDWTSEFATSIDESAWFVLLFMFELETYVLENESWEGWTGRIVHGVRLLCYVMIIHTVYAYAVTVISHQPTLILENVSSLCDMVGADVSYVYNLGYTEINEQTCDELSAASQFYWVGDDPVLSDIAGLELERDLALADLIEAVVWLLIVLAIEASVRLQEKEITSGSLVTSLTRLKILLYATLVAIGIYWASLSHWLYLWDELVWIGGFAAIEMNISEWRNEVAAKLATARYKD